VPSVDLELQTHSILVDAVYDTKDNYELKFGLVGRYQNNFPNPNTGVRRFIPDYNKYDFGSYFTSSFILNEKLNLDMGIRYDYNRLDTEKFYIKSRWEERGYDEDFADIIVEDLGTQLLTNPVYNFHNLSASSGISYQFDDHNNFIFNYSLASRPPNPAELFSDGLHHSLARIELGDLRFGKEISNKFSLSYEYKKKNLQIITDLYYNNVDNFIYLAPFGVEETIRGFYPVWNYRQTDAAVYGIDTYFNYSFNEYLSLENKSSLTFGEDRKENIPLIDIPPFNTITTFSYSKPNWHNFKFSLTSELVLEQNRFPDNNLEVFIPRTEEFIILDTSTPPPAYHLLHLSIQNTFYIHNKRLVTSLFVDNVLNTSYRNYLNQMRFFADDLGRHIRLQIQFNI
jgi:iron complex outermembrane receptor protein